MDNEIELVSDGEGLAVVGNQTAVERLLDSVGLLSLSKVIRLDNLAPVLRAGAEVARAGSEISANSARWLKMTEESARSLKEIGLTKTKTPGVSYAVLGKPGAISKWVEVENRPASLATNPALLSGVEGIMAQLARQQEANEITELLTSIDGKLDDVRRSQRDDVLANMDGITFLINEAMTIREHVGRVSQTAWSKVDQASAAIGTTQARALRELDALAGKAEGKTKVGELFKTAWEIELEVGVWLAVLARCFQVQDEIAVVELDYVQHAAPADLDGHRRALGASREDRRGLILRKTENLMNRMERAAGIADANVLLHAKKSRAVVDSINHVGLTIDGFHGPLGIESTRESLTATGWLDAVRDRGQLKNAGEEAGRVVGKGAIALAVGAAMSVVVAQVVELVKGETKSDE